MAGWSGLHLVAGFLDYGSLLLHIVFFLLLFFLVVYFLAAYG